jgi:hypothetical protein
MNTIVDHVIAEFYYNVYRYAIVCMLVYATCLWLIVFNMEEASIEPMRVPCTAMMTDRRWTHPSGFLPDLVLPAADADTRPGPGDLSILMRNVEARAPRPIFATDWKSIDHRPWVGVVMRIPCNLVPPDRGCQINPTLKPVIRSEDTGEAERLWERQRNRKIR